MGVDDTCGSDGSIDDVAADDARTDWIGIFVQGSSDHRGPIVTTESIGQESRERDEMHERGSLERVLRRPDFHGVRRVPR